MGKAPKPPDPQDTASAATGTNIGTAVAGAMMGNVNVNNPYGSSTTEQTGSFSYTDPYTGQTYDVPMFTNTQTYSPEVQGLIDTQLGNQQQIASAAGGLAGQMGNIARPINAPELNGNIANAGNIQTGLPNSGNIQTGMGPYQQASGNIANAGNIQTQVGDSGPIQTSIGPNDFSEDRRRVEDAMWERTSGDRAQRDEANRTRLLNSGIREGSAAWNAEMERMGRQDTDARLATIAAGGQEQALMQGLALNQGQFANQAQNQQFGQNLAGMQAGNQAQQQQFGQNTTQTQMGNQAAGQNFSQDLAAMQAGNQAQNQQFGQGLAGSQFANQAQNQQFNQNMATAQFGNQTAQQGFQNNLTGQNAAIANMMGLMGGSAPPSPSFQNPTNMPGIPTTDVAGIINNHYGQQMNQYGANQGVLGGLMGGIGSLIGLSDDRAKKDKKKVGHLNDVDLGVHEYRYKGEPKGAPKRLGLMASEVEKKRPDAIHRKGGLRYVDYSRALS